MSWIDLSVIRCCLIQGNTMPRKKKNMCLFLGRVSKTLLSDILIALFKVHNHLREPPNFS